MVLCLNLSLWCEINVYMNDLIVQQNLILICNVLKDHFNCNKKTKNTNFSENISMKIYKNKMTITKNKFSHQSFHFFLKLWSLE
jgi:hypothetical protein